MANLSVKEVKAQVADGIRDYQLHMRYLGVLEEEEDDEEAGLQHRARMESVFLCDLHFYQDYLNIKLSRMRTNEDTSDVLEHFRHALGDCPAVELWGNYLDVLLNLFKDDKCTEEDVTTAFEDAVTAVGIDILLGPVVWKKYQEWAVEEYLSLLEEEDEGNAEMKQKIISLYKRQLALPLLGNEDVLTDFNTLLESICVESDVDLIDPEGLQRAYSNALELRESRLIYEELITSDSFGQKSVEERILAWKAYIKFEIDENSFARARRLFERAVMDCREAEKMWIYYCEFITIHLKSWSLLLDVTERALRACGGSAELWQARMMALERSHASFDKVEAVLEMAIGSGTITTPENYLQLLLSYCDCCRRHHTLNEKPGEVNKEKAEIIRLAFNETIETIEKVFPTWDDALCMLYKYRAEVEEMLSACDDDVEAIYQESVRNLSKCYAAYKDFIAWARSKRRFKLCRSLFKQAFYAVEDSLGVGTEWIDFEKRVGAIEDLDEALKRIQPKRDAAVAHQVHQDECISEDKAQKTRRKTAKSVSTASSSTSVTSSSVTAFDSNNSENHRPTSHHMQVEAKDADENRARSEPSSAVSEIRLPVKRKAETAIETTNTEIGAVIVNNTSQDDGADLTSHSKLQRNVIFVNNLSFKAKEVDIQQAFESCGAVKAVRLVYRNKRPKGMCFVEFSDQGGGEGARAVQTALSSEPPVICGRKVTVDRSHATGEAAMFAKQENKKDTKTKAMHPTTVFVKKLPTTFQKSTLEQLFSHCGPILEVKMQPAVSKKGVEWMTALVQFHEPSAVEEALKLHGQPLDGSDPGKPGISVERSLFPVLGEALPPAKSAPSSEHKPSTLLAPRALMRKKSAIQPGSQSAVPIAESEPNAPPNVPAVPAESSEQLGKQEGYSNEYFRSSLQMVDQPISRDVILDT